MQACARRHTHTSFFIFLKYPIPFLKTEETKLIYLKSVESHDDELVNLGVKKSKQKICPEG